MRKLASSLIGLDVESGPGWRGLEFDDLAGVGLRRNPRRAQLLVSRVLAKHIPVAGHAATSAGRALATAVADALGGPQAADVGRASPWLLNGAADGQRVELGSGVLVIGLAETACGLAGIVADSISGAALAQTTRDARDHPRPWLEIDESHSHARRQVLLWGVNDQLATASLVLIVDDEISTGETAWQIVRDLNSSAPGRRYVVASLIDARSEANRRWLESEATANGIQLVVVSLVQATVHVPQDAVARVSQLVARGLDTPIGQVRTIDSSRVRIIPTVDSALPDARMGVGAATRDQMMGQVIRELVAAVQSGLSGRTLVLGVEEQMYPAIRLANALAADVQSTTRSPALAFDHADYPIQRGVTFASAYDGNVPAFLYNGADPTGSPAYSDVVLLYSGGGSADVGCIPADLLAAAGHCATGAVWAARLEVAPESERSWSQ